MPSLESGVIAFIAKYGFIKFFTLGAALAGAGLMAMFRPPKTRKEIFLQGVVALSASLLFGDTMAHFLDGWFDFVDYKTSPWEVWIQFLITVHCFVGSLSWGLFGGLAHLRDNLSNDPLKTVKDVKDII